MLQITHFFLKKRYWYKLGRCADLCMQCNAWLRLLYSALSLGNVKKDLHIGCRFWRFRERAHCSSSLQVHYHCSYFYHVCMSFNIIIASGSCKDANPGLCQHALKNNQLDIMCGTDECDKTCNKCWTSTNGPCYS